MEHSKDRPHSRGHATSDSPRHSVVPKKVFNCIVDQTSLIQGAKKSTRDGIPKWVAAGRIRLFVPLYALTQASRVKASSGRAATDAGEALEWLDDATSTYPHLVTLQGGYDKFETWAEVEQFALPRTLFSEEDAGESHDTEDSISLRLADVTLDNNIGDVDRSMSSNSTADGSTLPSDQSQRSNSPLSPPATPPKTFSTPKLSSPSSTKVNGASEIHRDSKADRKKSQVPRELQPLFNYILWRVHQEVDPAVALGSFIFLSDNQAMRNHASKFGIRCKTLQEIRAVIARESQDERNRQIVHRKGKAQMSNSATSLNAKLPSENTTVQTPSQSSDVHDEDEIILKRAPKAPAAIVNPAITQDGLMDPDQFIRGTGRGGSNNARGSTRGTPRTAAPRGRGGPGPRKRGQNQIQPMAGPIDPDSFARPSSSRGGPRGGGGRGLWQPT